MTSLYCHGFPLIFFWWYVWSDSATQTSYTSKCSNFLKKIIDTISTSNFYLKFKENNKIDILFCYFSRHCFRPTSMAALSLSALTCWSTLKCNPNWNLIRKTGKWHHLSLFDTNKQCICPKCRLIDCAGMLLLLQLLYSRALLFTYTRSTKVCNMKYYLIW